MARHIQFTEYTETGSVDSETQDEYQEYTVTAIKNGEAYWEPDEGVNLRLYRHEPSGIVTTDPERFEAWLRQRRL